MHFSRKSFLQTLGSASLGLLGARFSAKENLNKTFLDHQLTFGLASYSLREFSLNEVIQMTQRVELKYLCLKSMHLPMDSSVATLNEVASKVKAARINLYGAGVVYMKNKEEVFQAFEYAKQAGMTVIVGVPNPELLGLVEKTAIKYDIKLAIHNHGPGDKTYPSPDSIYDKIKALDKRIGICMDIGHTERIGMNCSEKAEEFAGRLYDIHLKDVDQRGAPGKSVELGRGIIDIPQFLKTLRKIKYQGVVSLEYEKDGKDPLPGLAESVGYFRGIMDTIK